MTYVCTIFCIAGEIVTFSACCGDSGLERRWRDGSLELDLPTQALGELFNCNHTIVGQTNPHIVPLVNIKNKLPKKWGNILEAELKHRCQVCGRGWGLAPAGKLKGRYL